jgi:RHS repeat-associated protein
VNGVILCQATDGVVHHFVPDPLGSVVMVRDAAGNTVYEAEYSLYGQVQSETGTNPSSLGYVGTLGYITDSPSSLYVRARYLLPGLGRWLTKDPRWPDEPGYGYAHCDLWRCAKNVQCKRSTGARAKCEAAKQRLLFGMWQKCKDEDDGRNNRGKHPWCRSDGPGPCPKPCNTPKTLIPSVPEECKT